MSKEPEYHGMTNTSMYRRWAHIKSRCSKENNPAYRWYGGRGIKMCEKWKESFMSFYKDVGDPPTSKHTLDRIDNNKGYEPGNIRWATMAEQNKNREVMKRGYFAAPRKDNKSGYTGVYKCNARWMVRFKKKHVGMYATFEEAVAARRYEEDNYKEV